MTQKMIAVGYSHELGDNTRRFSSLEAVLQRCLGYLPDYVGRNVPDLQFGYIGTNFEDLGAKLVETGQQEHVADQVAQAYSWCADRFPLSVRDPVSRTVNHSINRFIIGYSRHANEVLSASSAQAPGIVFMAAEWPLTTPYRFASLIAHESIHQGLFAREVEASPVRSRSFGYSPWKNTLRPGRLVWHAFWTFTCQFTLLAESILESDSLIVDDYKLNEFLADMEARVAVCLYSLELSEIISRDELERCKEAYSISVDLSQKLLRNREYQLAHGQHRETAWQEFEQWAKDMVNSTITSEQRSYNDTRD